MSRRPLPLFAVLLPLALLLLGTCAAEAEEGAVVVPVLAGALSGGEWPGEEAWAGAARLDVGTLDEPAFAPDVRVLAAAGRLFVRVEADEPPGEGMGVSLLVAPEPVERAGDALALAYAPQSVRSPRYVVRGPKGVGRQVYAFDGTADVSLGASWRVVVALSLGDLDLHEPHAKIALALAVRARDPARVVWAPPSAAFAGPRDGAWFRLGPPEGTAWPVEGAGADEKEARDRAAARAAADERDLLRLQAWQDFVRADQKLGPDTMLLAAFPDGPSALAATSDQFLEAARKTLLAPLERASAARPDLAYPHVVRGHVLADLRLEAEALDAFRTAEELVPGLREAQAGMWLAVRGPALGRGPAGARTDYAAALARADEVARTATTPLAKDGATFGRALLELLRGEFETADAALEPLARRHPATPGIVLQAERARGLLTAWPRERQYRGLEAKKDDLPRVRLTTSKGDVLLELFEDDAPNTTKNFVWLVEHGFYAGQALSWVVPYVGWIAAEPRIEVDPGYRIPAEEPARPRRQRRLYRGTIAMVSTDPDASSSAFLVTTGTATHLDDAFVAFGRVIEGQDVVEALTGDDRLVSAEVLRKRPGVEYRPVTVEGVPAPAPR